MAVKTQPVAAVSTIIITKANSAAATAAAAASTGCHRHSRRRQHLHSHTRAHTHTQMVPHTHTRTISISLGKQTVCVSVCVSGEVFRYVSMQNRRQNTHNANFPWGETE